MGLARAQRLRRRGRRRRALQREHAARLQLEQPLVDAARRGHVLQPQVLRQRLPAHRVAEAGQGAQRLQLGAEGEDGAGVAACGAAVAAAAAATATPQRRPGARHPAVVQRLLAEAVARQVQRAGVLVPQRQREHAHAAPQRVVHAPVLERGEQRLGVGVPAPRGGGGAKLGPQREVVVDLAVEGDHPAPAGRGHGLVPGGREVHDRQPAVRQRQAGRRVQPHAAVVRPAVPDRIGHGRAMGAGGISRERAAGEEACKAAHEGCSGARRPAVG